MEIISSAQHHSPRCRSIHTKVRLHDLSIHDDEVPRIIFAVLLCNYSYTALKEVVGCKEDEAGLENPISRANNVRDAEVLA